MNDKRERMENGSTGDKEKDGCKDVILWKYFQREKNFIGGRGLRVKMKFLIQDIILYSDIFYHFLRPCIIINI